MNEEGSQGSPLWFKILNVLFLVWNLFGLAVFVLAMTVLRSREALEDAGLNEAQVDLTLTTPTWVNVMFGLAVIFGVLGCIALLLKSKLALPLLLISLVGVLGQNTYMYLLSDTVEVMGVGASPLVIAGAVLLIPYAWYATKSGWLK